MTDQENNLVGCVNPDGSKLCDNLPNITWRFVTAMAKGEPHHWTSMGGDAQQGALSVMFDGPRVNGTYDPMRKQGAILLGNGGDNSNGSQGTFYEGAMTAAGTFPTDATDQLVQANVVAAKYDVPRLSLAPASATAAPPGLQTFSPGSSQDTTVTFTNTTECARGGRQVEPFRAQQAVDRRRFGKHRAIEDVRRPGRAGCERERDLQGHLGAGGLQRRPGRQRFRGPAPTARRNPRPPSRRCGTSARSRSTNFASAPALHNPTNSFIELYNAGASDVDISNWTLTEHPTQQAIFSAVKIPAGTKLAAHGFYLLGLANSGLAVPAHKGDTTIHVRSTTGMSVGDTIGIDTGSGVETRKIASSGRRPAPVRRCGNPSPTVR